MPLQAWFPEGTVDVEPGGGFRLPLTVENPTPYRDGCTITPSGIRASWITVAQPSVVLDPGGAVVVDVWLHPPLAWATTAGPNEISVRIVADSEPTLSLTVDAVVNVSAFDRRSLSFVQSVVRARRRASFDLIVDNEGNEMAEFRMRLVDPSANIDGEFDPPVVTVPPGDSARVRLKAKTSFKLLRTSDRLLGFEVDATESGHPTASASGSLLQVKTISGEWFGRIIPVLIPVGLMAAGWIWLARPWIEQQIDARVSEVAVSAPSAEDQRPSTDGSTDAQPDPNGDPDSTLGSGDILSARLATDPGPGESADAVYPVDTDRAWLISDVVLQNPQRDRGRAVLRLGDQVWYEWDLALMTNPNEFQPRVTPFKVDPGTEITLSVECESVGSNTADGCSISVLLGGFLAEP